MSWTDDDLPAYLAELGVPGIVDAHSHFMPKPVMDKVWAYFESGGEKVGREWPITYRFSEDERVATLQKLGVTRFTSLCYAHRPDMAAWLTQWALDFAQHHPQAIPSGTFFPEPGVREYTAAAIESGVRVFKLHLQVVDIDPRDERLTPVWGLLCDTGIPVVVHCGSGPVAGRFTGFEPMAAVVRDFPDLPLIVAHMGMPEVAEYVGLAETYDRVRLDTTMVDTKYLPQDHHLDRAVLPRVRELALDGRVLFGSDFPNIPYQYAEQVEALARWDLGDDCMRAVLFENGEALFGA